MGILLEFCKFPVYHVHRISGFNCRRGFSAFTPAQFFWAFLQYISLFSVGLFNLLLYCKASVSGHFTV